VGAEVGVEGGADVGEEADGGDAAFTDEGLVDEVGGDPGGVVEGADAGEGEVEGLVGLIGGEGGGEG
jgi:hypothetical protein